MQIEKEMEKQVMNAMSGFSFGQNQESQYTSTQMPLSTSYQASQHSSFPQSAQKFESNSIYDMSNDNQAYQEK